MEHSGQDHGASNNLFGFVFYYNPLSNQYAVAATAGTLSQLYSAKKGTFLLSFAGSNNPAEWTTPGGEKPKATNEHVNICQCSKTSNGFTISYSGVFDGVTRSFDCEISFTNTSKYIAYIVPVSKADYESWLPQGDQIGSTPPENGNTTSFKTIIVEKAHPTVDVSSSHPFKVKYTLIKVSNCKGICSNYPFINDNPNTKKDLKWDNSLTTHQADFDGLNIEADNISSKETNGASVVAVVKSEDYGAYGEIIADVVLQEDGKPLRALNNYDNGFILTIPFDRNGNQIADAWEKRPDINIYDKNFSKEWDEDKKPVNGNDGDDIALFDEYRGFAVMDADNNLMYKRLSPNEKELFTIAAKTEYSDEVRKGVEGYAAINHIKVYHFLYDKYAASEPGATALYRRWINFNSPLDHKTFAVVINIYTGPIVKDGSLGYTKSLYDDAFDEAHDGAFYPAEVNYCFIQEKEIEQQEVLKEATPPLQSGTDRWKRTRCLL